MIAPNIDHYYVHFKGHIVKVRLIVTHTETEEEMVVYAHDGKVWVRPLSSWNEKVRWKDGIERQRFVPVEEAPMEKEKLETKT